MAELVDALVSNTSIFTDMPVRPRLGVPQKQKKALSEISGGAFFASGVQKRSENTEGVELLLLSK
jgi:hypothetical protein